MRHTAHEPLGLTEHHMTFFFAFVNRIFNSFAETFCEGAAPRN